ncbi:hypothetical protein IJG04_01240 [Candidatus Saccharibacteria bacterium]|nr:hypothetical protein [Candidatus Saccharibacteria bacterium]
MKTDLATSILAGVVGVVAAYFVCNLLLPEIPAVGFSVLGTSDSYNLTQPDEEIFNYRALNPTVEVYVGECKKYNENNECIDDQYQTNSNDETDKDATDENDNTNQNDNSSNNEGGDSSQDGNTSQNGGASQSGNTRTEE